MAQSVARPRTAPLTCPGHTRPVVHLEYSEKQDDGTFVLLSSCSVTGLATGSEHSWVRYTMTYAGHKGAVWSAKLSGGAAARAATGSADFSAKVWDTYTGECAQTLTHNHIVRSVAINHAGTQLLTGGHEKKLRIFDLQHIAGSSADHAQLFKPSSGCDDGTTHSGTIRSVVLGSGTSGAENTVVTAAEDRCLQWWDLRTLAPVHEMRLDEPLTSMDRCIGTYGEFITVTSGKQAIFMDLTRFVAGSTGDEWVRVYDYEDAKLLDLHKGHHGPVHCVSYTPDGEVAASGSEDGTIRLWQVNPGTKYGLWT